MFYSLKKKEKRGIVPQKREVQNKMKVLMWGFFVVSQFMMSAVRSLSWAEAAVLCHWQRWPVKLVHFIDLLGLGPSVNSCKEHHHLKLNPQTASGPPVRFRADKHPTSLAGLSLRDYSPSLVEHH